MYFLFQDIHEGDRDFRDTLPFASGAATCRGILDSLVSAGDAFDYLIHPHNYHLHFDTNLIVSFLPAYSSY